MHNSLIWPVADPEYAEQGRLTNYFRFPSRRHDNTCGVTSGCITTSQSSTFISECASQPPQQSSRSDGSQTREDVRCYLQQSHSHQSAELSLSGHAPQRRTASHQSSDFTPKEVIETGHSGIVYFRQYV